MWQSGELAPGEKAAAAGGALAAFQHPNFRYYMAARFLIVTSSEMQSLAVAWQIYGITQRPFDLGLVGLAQFIPGIVLFLAAGHAADRFPRQRILAACYAAFSLCSVLLLITTLRGPTSVWPVYAVLILNGSVRAFNGSAGQAFLPLLVPEVDFPNAVAWGSSMFQASTILGPIAGGLVYGIAGSPIPVYISAAVAYGIGLALISAIRLPAPRRTQPAASLGMVLDGLRYIRDNKLILGTISLDLVAVLLGGAVALLPVYAREVLHAGAYGLGILRSAPGAGAVLTAIAVAHWPLRRRAGAAMLWCVFGFGVFTVMFGLSKNFALSVAALALAGACDMVSVIVRHTLVQLATPDEMRGRVSAVNMVFIGASNEIGQFESGLTAQWFGTIAAVVIGGIGTIATVLVWSRLFPVLRHVDRFPSATNDK
jgi:MFS family permease